MDARSVRVLNAEESKDCIFVHAGVAVPSPAREGETVMMTSLLVSMTLAIGQAPPAPTPTTTIPANRRVAQAPEKPATDDGSQPSTPPNEPGTVQQGMAEPNGFFRTLCKAYKSEFFPDPSAPPAPEEPEAPRRAPPSPWDSPPFPVNEYQGYPLVGVPPTSHDYPLMKAINATRAGDFFKDHKIEVYGWVTASGNWSTAKNSNSPASYWLVPNRYELDQAIVRVERQLDSVQKDHIDWGFRSSFLYGIDYRYMAAGGWFSNQLLEHNRLNGFDPTEQYVDVYFPGVADGMIVRVGRWIACPDIETQFSPDNYLGSHSILFTFDTYTQTGVMVTWQLNRQWMFQLGIDAGNDMAPWYKGAEPCGFVGLRWVSRDNNDAMYTCLNQINSARFHHFIEDGQPAGHDNFNYLVTTWEHRFSKEIHTKTEAYYMWMRDGELGGTPSLGPVQSFGGGGGDGTLIPGFSQTYGILNYSEFMLTKKDYFTVRNEVWKDTRGMRSGFPGTYTSHTIGISHNFNSVFQVRPEIGYYRNWNEPAFDLGKARGIWLYGFDMTLRF
jgi:hypothetical protein